MFEKDLKNRFKRIFGLDKVTYDSPGEVKEQEGVFIQIDSARSVVKEGLQTSKVKGLIAIFANSEKLPFGYINKKINSADPSDTRDLFFYNIDQNVKYFGNLVERRASFDFFFVGQYDPEHGEITSLELTIDED